LSLELQALLISENQLVAGNGLTKQFPLFPLSHIFYLFVISGTILAFALMDWGNHTNIS
jgi:hypothetical protein